MEEFPPKKRKIIMNILYKNNCKSQKIPVKFGNIFPDEALKIPDEKILLKGNSYKKISSVDIMTDNLKLSLTA